MITKQEIINKINDLTIERVKLLAKLELLEEQEKEVKVSEGVKKEETINDVKENGEATGL